MKSAKSKKMLSGLDHVVLVVREMDTSIQFYCDVLGLQLRYDGRPDGGTKHSFLGDESSSYLALMEDRNRGLGEGEVVQSVDHVAFSVKDVEQVHDELARRGVKFTGQRVDGDAKGKSYYFKDPDGLELEIYGPVK